MISIHAPPRGATSARSTPARKALPYFNSRPSARGDLSGALFFVPPSYFNSRPSARGDVLHHFSKRIENNFNSRPSARGDQKVVPLGFHPRLISIHAPPRGATSARIAIYCRDIFQFTPLREGRPFGLPRFPSVKTFQFTPLREGRRASEIAVRTLSANFNSRPSARGDGGCTRNHLFQGISIHAPPRGATCRGLYFLYRPPISIHAPPRGATCGSCFSKLTDIFQFTPLREGRRSQASHRIPPDDFNSRPSARGDPALHYCTHPCDNFNSRPSARGDIRFKSTIFPSRISIHAPPRGATPLLFPVGNYFTPISIHAPPRGATRWLYTQPSFSRHFNSRPSARGDDCQRVQPILPFISIHAPPRGATFSRHSFASPFLYFNSRPSARGDARRNGDIAAKIISIHAPPRGATRRLVVVICA